MKSWKSSTPNPLRKFLSQRNETQSNTTVEDSSMRLAPSSVMVFFHVFHGAQ
jgi:hypothetical protein